MGGQPGMEVPGMDVLGKPTRGRRLAACGMRP
jgi:hypothetical protein